MSSLAHPFVTWTESRVVEVLSTSNTQAKLNRQRLVAKSAGAKELWIVDPDARVAHVTDLRGSTTYGTGEAVSLAIFGNATQAVDQIFTV